MNGSVQRIVVSLGLVAGLAGVVGAKDQADYKPDSWITMKTKLALLTDTEVSGSSINVDTVNGRVTLHGKVETNSEKTRAADLAKRIEGAGEVRNLLQVVPDTKKSAMNVFALEGRDALKHVDVEVTNSVARLTGTVPDPSDRLHASVVVRSTPGVRSVRNDLRVSTQ